MKFGAPVSTRRLSPADHLLDFRDPCWLLSSSQPWYRPASRRAIRKIAASGRNGVTLLMARRIPALAAPSAQPLAGKGEAGSAEPGQENSDNGREDSGSAGKTD